MRIFKNKAFTRFAKKAGIGDAMLCEAIRDAERGLIAADLGGGVIKQRIARPGHGKSGGFRTLIVFRAGARAFLCPRLREERTGQHWQGRTDRSKEARIRIAGI
ncbi:MAG: type II toxin-antitoxin system RelE/ParE family toxin [Bryobacteraceae bacterium]